MLVVKVELWSAITGQKKELGRVLICNDGTGTGERGNYNVAALRGRDAASLQSAMLKYLTEPGDPAGRKGRVERYPRASKHVWNLVAQALKTMRYE